MCGRIRLARIISWVDFCDSFQVDIIKLQHDSNI